MKELGILTSRIQLEVCRMLPVLGSARVTPSVPLIKVVYLQLGVVSLGLNGVFAVLAVTVVVILIFYLVAVE